jgi:hypothetical protein
LFSPYYSAAQHPLKGKRGTVANDWEALRDAMAQHFPDSRIAVLPCAPLQIPELEG